LSCPFPSYDDYRRFLERNPNREFKQGCYYKCAMAILGQGPVGEGYASDLDMDAPDWFGEHERRAVKLGMWTGLTKARDILAMLLEIDPDGCYPLVTKDPSTNLRRNQTVQIGGWRARFDMWPPSEKFLANFLRDCPPGQLVEAVMDVEKIGRGPFSLTEDGVVKGDKVLGHLGKRIDKSVLAAPGAAKTRHLRAYPLQ